MKPNLYSIAGWSVTAGACLLALLLFVPRPVCSELQEQIKRGSPDLVYRPLTDEQVRKIARLSDLLVTRIRPRNRDEEENPSDFQGKRINAAQELGSTELSHPWCMPALLAVLRDPTDDPALRRSCVESLSFITDKRVVDFLLDAMLDENAEIASKAAEGVQELTGQTIEFDPTVKKPVREEKVKQLRAWWNSNKDRMRLQRN